MAAPPTKPGKYCMLDPSPPMGTFNTARSNQVSMTLLAMKPNNFLTLVIGGGYFERLRSIRRFAAPVFRSFSQLSVSIKKYTIHTTTYALSYQITFHTYGILKCYVIINIQIHLSGLPNEGRRKTFFRQYRKNVLCIGGITLTRRFQ